MTCMNGPESAYGPALTIELVPNQIASCVLCGEKTSTRVAGLWVCVTHEELDRIKLIQIERKLDGGK